MQILSQEALRNWTPPIDSVVITDLDEPLTGQLNIPDWHEYSTPEEIAKDILRPWGVRFAELAATREDCIFGICTSREFTEADYQYMSNNLNIARNSGMIWHRETGCEESREALKSRLFIKNIFENITLLMQLNLGRMYFFDDKVKNVLAAEALGIQGILVYN